MFFVLMKKIKLCIIIGEVKRVRKVKVIFLLFLLCISIGGCIRPMSRRERLMKGLGSEDEIADQIMEDIAAALDAGDADALKSLFSKTALEEATDIDQQISNLLMFYEGELDSFKGFNSSSNDIEHGKNVKKQIIGQYQLTTDKETYRIIYHYNVIDKENPDKVGLSLLEVVTDELYQEDDFDYIGEDPGVYIQK